MTDEQPVMIACAPGETPGETLGETRAHARNSVQSLALLLLISPC